MSVVQPLTRPCNPGLQGEPEPCSPGKARAAPILVALLLLIPEIPKPSIKGRIHTPS